MGRGVGVGSGPGVDRSGALGSDTHEPGQAEPSPLEVRYRRLLRVLPVGYRAVREQEMVDTFLASECAADPDNADLTLRLGWPSVREAAGVLALAVRARWAGVAAPERGQVRAGALRIAVLAALTVFAVLAVFNLLSRIWLAAAHPGDSGVVLPGVGSVDALWASVRDWSFLLWIVALVAVLAGRPRWAQVAGAVPLLTALVGIVAYPGGTDSWPMLVYPVTLLLVQAVVLVGLTGFEDRVPVPGRRGWIITAAVAVLALSAVSVAAWALPIDVMYPVGLALFLDEAGPWCVAAVIAAVVLLVRRARGVGVSTAALLGVAGLAVAAVALRAGWLTIWVLFLPSDFSQTVPILTAASIQLLAAAAVAAVTGILGARRFRRLPPVRYDIAI